MSKSFKKVKENFVCDHCGTQVTGTGYTNHCPDCLYSKHVDDKFPGDRASKCKGLMKPVSSTLKADQLILLHQCLKCQKITPNQTSPQDNQTLLVKLSAHPSPLKSSRGES